jgi:ubiquinone biosynthesis protein COQ9
MAIDMSVVSDQLSMSELRLRLLNAFLHEVVSYGWTEAALVAACESVGVDLRYGKICFPEGLDSLEKEFSNTINNEAQKVLPDDLLKGMRVHERIRALVLTNFDVMRPHKAAIGALYAKQKKMAELPKALTHLCQVSDMMWRRAGDTSSDMNYYSKRLLLSGVYASTLLYWLKDESPKERLTRSFLDKRLSDVMRIGKFKSSVKNALAPMCSVFKRS